MKAPGRINIMGEHTDYNLGYVLPAAIDHHMYIGFAKNDTGTFNAYSIDYDQTESVALSEVAPSDVSWLSLIAGVVDQLKDKIQGFDLAFYGDIPEGAGLSSSAALCCGTGFGIDQLFDLQLEKWDIAKIAQNSEHNFAGVKCGIMDQFASMFGLTNHVLILDCADLTYQESEIDTAGYKFILVDSNVKHELNESDYNARREESADALQRLKGMDKKVHNFRDVSLEFIQNLESEDVWWKRAYHIISENQRVLDISKALKEKKIDLVGKLLNEGHYSERYFYEITCAETDFLVEELNKEETLLGARQVGGGFGGCVLGIVKDQEIDQMIERVNAKYKKAFGKTTRRIPIVISRGCHLIEE